MTHLLEVFPDFNASEELDEDNMKSKTGKEKWRSFMMKYDKTVEDYNFGTLLRRAADVEYEEKTTMFAPRMQVGLPVSPPEGSTCCWKARGGVVADTCSSTLSKLLEIVRVSTIGSTTAPKRGKR